MMSSQVSLGVLSELAGLLQSMRTPRRMGSSRTQSHRVARQSRRNRPAFADLRYLSEELGANLDHVDMRELSLLRCQPQLLEQLLRDHVTTAAAADRLDQLLRDHVTSGREKEWVSSDSFYTNKTGFTEEELLATHYQPDPLGLEQTSQPYHTAKKHELAAKRDGSTNHNAASLAPRDPTRQSRLLLRLLYTPDTMQQRNFHQKRTREGKTSTFRSRFTILVDEERLKKEPLSLTERILGNSRADTDSSQSVLRNGGDAKGGRLGDNGSINSLNNMLGSLKESIDKNNQVHKRVWSHEVVMMVVRTTLLLVVISVAYKMINGDKNLGNSLFRTKINEFEPADSDVRFSDVKGCEEVKEQLQDLVRYLNQNEEFEQIGARLPKGVLLSGPPGIGKTLMAKAVAGEAGVPFVHASGSEFDEMFVGVGARRVRQLFATARTQMPCVIFIDEIDSVGRKRVSGDMFPYANQTINQLLAEMDGFNSSDGILVLAATNNPKSLDPALVRSGRFDTQISVTLPDKKGRKEILELYLDKIEMADDLDVDHIASQTVGFSGADLSNLVNQAAIRAVKCGARKVTTEHIKWAREFIAMGPEKRHRALNEEATKNTAYHEAGHAIVAQFTKHASPIDKITVIPRGMALGFTSFMNEESHDYGRTRGQLQASMDVAMGGYVAEEMMHGPDGVSTGASSDFQNATETARAMVTIYGMSDKVGQRSVNTDKPLSDELHALIDGEINRLLKDSYTRARSLLEYHKADHEILTEALIEFETLESSEVTELLRTRSLKAVHTLRCAQEAKRRENKKGEDQGKVKQGRGGGSKEGLPENLMQQLLEEKERGEKKS